MYFYDGRAEVHYGIVTLPAEKPAWIQRVFMKGYRVDPVTGKVLELAEIMHMAQDAISPPVAVESTKSAGENVENTHTRGQSARSNRLRESQSDSGKSLSKRGLGDSVSDGIADGAEGNIASDSAVSTGEDGPSGVDEDD